MKDKIKVLGKIAKAKVDIRNTPIKKEGKNKFSNYDYFTPSQITEIVQDACEKNGLITLFGTFRDESGELYATLTVVDVASGESFEYHQITAIPDIKATNIAQQLGGMNTYSNRYLLMFAFDIVDNNLDFDTTENTKKQVAKEAISKNAAKANSQKPAKATKSENVAAKDNKLPALTAKSEKYAIIVQFIKGGGSWDDVLKKYTVSATVKKSVIAAAKK